MPFLPVFNSSTDTSTILISSTCVKCVRLFVHACVCVCVCVVPIFMCLDLCCV